MRWARTLMIADMLTKAIQSNVAHEARPNANRTDKEALMSDDQLPPTTPVAAATDAPVDAPVDAQTATAAPAPAPAVAEPSAVAHSAVVDVDARLHHATRLAEMLTNNPKIHSFLCTLMGIAHEDMSKDI